MKTDNLIKLIKDTGLKNKYIAEKLGITPVYLSFILNGSRKAEKQKMKILIFLQNFLTKAA